MRERELTRRIREFFRLGSGDVQTQVGGSAYNPAAVAITGGTITGVSGLAYDVAKWAIPVTDTGSGSMANNGVMTLTNALTTTYSPGYYRVPAGAIAAGVPAAAEIYYGVASSTTVITLFNNTLSANLSSVGAPLIPASPTAFVTTGPGAFTGLTTAFIPVTITVPAGAPGINGQIGIEGDYSVVNAATNKTVTCKFGGTNVVGVTQTTVTNINYVSKIKNRASASAQVECHSFGTSASVTYQPPTFPAINTANAVAIDFQMQKATATESMVFEGGRVAVDPT